MLLFNETRNRDLVKEGDKKGMHHVGAFLEFDVTPSPNLGLKLKLKGLNNTN
jgi:hypothetical protein